MIPVAMVLLVGIGVLAVAINRISSQSNHGSILEGISLQAFFAAESGANIGLHRLLYDVADSASADIHCDVLSGSVIQFSASGLQSCSSELTCTVASVNTSKGKFYTIRSKASCGSGDIFSERIIEVTSLL